MRSPAEQNFGVSEYAIEQAIQARIASPGFFQRVAEEVACGLYPDLANRLVPFGRNTDDKTIQLLAAVGLLGRSIPPRTFQPLGQDRLNSALLSHPPMPDRGITANQAGLWHGVREWLHLDQESFTADRSLAEDVLRVFRAAESGGRRRIALLNGIMVDRLEQCQAQGWCLVPEERSVLDALEDAGED